MAAENLQPDYPPKFEILPEGTAAMYLRSVGLNPIRDDVDRLVELFKLYYERGKSDSLKD